MLGDKNNLGNVTGKAGATVHLGSFVEKNADDNFVPYATVTVPPYGVATRMNVNDTVDTIAVGDTVAVTVFGEVQMKAKAGLTLANATKYDSANNQISDTGVEIKGIQVIAIDGTVATVRLGGAFNL